MNKIQLPFYVQITILLLLFTLLFFGLINARDFLYPVALAILFSGLLYPMVSFLQKKKFPKALAILTSIFSAIVVIGGLGYLLSVQFGVFLENFSELKAQAAENIRLIRQSLHSRVGIQVNLSPDWLFDQLNSMSGEVFTATTGTIVKIGLQPVYVFFFLYYREKFFRFIYKIVPERRHSTVEEILLECGVISKNYLGGLFVVVLILCVVNSTGLYVIGIKYAILFGILSAIANFIPYFGTLIGGSIPLLYALVAESPTKAFYVVILFVIIQFLENNILTPRITGGHVNINPIITIMGIIIGGMVWGIPGMFLSVPALAVIKSICSHIKSLQPVAYLLERESNGSQE